jgi:hypothetical protein
MLKCDLCGVTGGTNSVTHAITCIYKNHITYKKANGELVILRIKNNSESFTIKEYNNIKNRTNITI